MTTSVHIKLSTQQLLFVLSHPSLQLPRYHTETTVNGNRGETFFDQLKYIYTYTEWVSFCRDLLHTFYICIRTLPHPDVCLIQRQIVVSTLAWLMFWLNCTTMDPFSFPCSTKPLLSAVKKIIKQQQNHPYLVGCINASHTQPPWQSCTKSL